MGNLNKKYVAACFLALLLFHIIYHLLSEPMQPNSKLFVEISRNMLEQGSYSFDGEQPTRLIQPLYTIFVMIFYHILGLKATGVVMAQIILDMIAFIFVIKTANLVYNGSLPKILPLLLAGHFAIWFFGLYLINECLYIFITVLGIYFLVKAVKYDKNLDFMIAGLLGGLALLTRPVGLGYIAFLFIPVFLFRKKLRKPVLKLILIYAAVLVTVLPWTIRNAMIMGKMTPLSSEDRYHLLYASLPDSVTADREYLIFDPINTEPDEVADTTNIMKKAIDNILSKPFSFLWRGMQKVVMVWTNFPGTREFKDIYLIILSKTLQFGILFFTLIGFIKTEKKYAMVLILPAVFYSLILFFTYATTRFTVPALPFLLILTARGFEPVMKYIFRVFRGDSVTA
jgi:4-amino-4-deoxy-L-arabinose transferase-like glycosyltransferase